MMPILCDFIELIFLLYLLFQDLKTQRLSLRGLMFFGLTEYVLAILKVSFPFLLSWSASERPAEGALTLSSERTCAIEKVFMAAADNTLSAHFGEVLRSCCSVLLVQLLLLILTWLVLFLAEKLCGHFLLGAADLLLPLLMLPRLGLKKALLLFPLASFLSIPAFALQQMIRGANMQKTVKASCLPLYPFYFCALLCLRAGML